MRNRTYLIVVILSLLAILSSNPTLHAARSSRKEVIVYLSGDGYVRGWIVQNKLGGNSIITVEGENIPLRETDQIFSISTLKKELQKKKSDIEEEGDETKAYLHLMLWAKDRCLYEDTYTLAKKVVKRMGTKAERVVVDTLKWAEEKLALLKKASPPNPADFTWNEDDIQKIRFALLPLEGEAEDFRISVSTKLIREFIQNESHLFSSEEEKAEFLKAPPIKQVQFIKKHTGFKYQSEINITSDPVVIAEFKRLVYPLILKAYKDPKSKLSTFKLPIGKSAPAQIYGCFYLIDSEKYLPEKLIDHSSPESSKLIEYLEESRKLPEATKQRIIEWIKTLPEKNIDQIVDLIEENDPLKKGK